VGVFKKTKSVKAINELSAVEVARFFLSQEQPNETWAITYRKLQCLVYYAQGWSLALRNKPLIKNVPLSPGNYDEISAMSNGPFIYSIWHFYHHFGSSALPQISTLNKKLSESDGFLLEKVWKTYGHFSPNSLTVLSRSETPWVNAWAHTKGDKRLITDEELKSYFTEFLSDESFQSQLEPFHVKQA
jgi:uncharacterized phage-associated protein